MVQPSERLLPASDSGAGASTRQRILLAARDLFSEYGYDATSVRMVAKKCGLTNPAVHYHFRTKRDLYDSLLAAPIGTSSDTSPRDRLSIAAHMEQRFYDWVENVPFARLLLRQQIGADPQSLDYLSQNERVYVAELTEALSHLYGAPAGERIAQIAFTMLCGAFWDALLTYGNEAEAVMRDEYFRTRVRTLVTAALNAAERLAP